uniref:Putative ovule protein n=1 Tax=Solanum chacoense TaxID=4108 RepID=A0A0V0GR44_SOLCH
MMSHIVLVRHGFSRGLHPAFCVTRRCPQSLKVSFIEEWLDRLCCMGWSVGQSRTPRFKRCK